MELEWCLVIFTFIDFFFPSLCLAYIYFTKISCLSKFLFQVEMA